MQHVDTKYEILALSESNFDESVNLLTQYWHVSPMETERLLRWKYVDCPLASVPLFYVALHEGLVVGTLGFFPIPFVLNGNSVNVLCPGDAFTLPEHRRFGIYTKLFLYGQRELSQQFDYLIALSANPISAAGLVKIGWRPLGMRKEQSYFRLTSCIRYLVKKKGARLHQESLVSDPRKITELYARIPGYHHVDERTSCIPASVLEYLEWRYSNPVFNYAAIPYYRDGELLAFAVCMVAGRDVFLLDYRELQGAAALEHVVRAMKKHICAPRILVSVFMFSERDRRTLSRCGFHDYRRLINLFVKRPAVPILVHPVCENPQADRWYIHGRDMSQPDSWFIPEFANDGY